MNVIDKRNFLASSRSRSYRRRAKSSIRNIAIHHSATATGSAEAFARYHVNELGWPGIGYHYVVDKQGMVSICHDLEVVSYHVGNSNGYAVGICMVGDFRNEALGYQQRESTLELTRNLMRELNIPVENVWGHIEFPGYSWKPCPSINMEFFRNQLREDGATSIGSGLTTPSSLYISGERQRTILTMGDQGDDVKALQERLMELGFQPGPIDGIYGPLTVDAVSRFQRVVSILVDGIVGPQTRAALKDFSPLSEQPEQGSPTDEPDDREELYNGETRRILLYIRPMMRGTDVQMVQEKVGAIVDGIYGPDTEEKVRVFQRKEGLTIDGIVGPQTWRALDRVQKTSAVSYQRLLSLQTPYLRGEDVRRVQRALRIPADGLYGPVTERAVRKFQQREGIVVDGIMGPRTWSRLFNE